MGHMKCGARPVSAHLSTLLNCHKKVYTTTFKNINCDLFSALNKKKPVFHNLFFPIWIETSLCFVLSNIPTPFF